jgi:long-subunit fatty acid transport protein
MLFHRVSGIPVVLALLTGAATAAHAQSTSAINGGIQFDFSLPGARSLGMAGAFVAVADDVSAAQANPAGLTVLSRPEISIEFRGWNFYSLSPDIGHAYGNPTNIGTDTVSGIQNKTLRDTRAAPGFFSLAMPAGQWVLAGYFQQFSKFKNRIEENGPYMTVPEGVDRLFPVTGLIELDIVDYGFSVGRRINSRWSVGGGVALYDFTLRSRSEAYLVTPFDVVPPPAQRPSLTDPGEKFGPAVFSDSNILVRQEQDGESLAVAFNAGVTWQPSAKVRVGGAFRQGPNFKFDSQFFLGPALVVPGVPAGFQIDNDPDILFHVPDSYSFGVMYRPNDALMLGFEYDRVQYSQLLNGDGNGKPVETAGQIGSGNPEVEAEGVKRVNGYELDDSNQLRVGAEYYFSGPKLLLRLGSWFDPDHRQRFTDQSLPQEVINAPGGENVVHFSGGLGRDFGRFRIDGAVDLSPYLNTFSVTTVVYLR